MVEVSWVLCMPEWVKDVLVWHNRLCRVGWHYRIFAVFRLHIFTRLFTVCCFMPIGARTTFAVIWRATFIVMSMIRVGINWGIAVGIVMLIMTKVGTCVGVTIVVIMIIVVTDVTSVVTSILIAIILRGKCISSIIVASCFRVVIKGCTVCSCNTTYIYKLNISAG